MASDPTSKERLTAYQRWELNAFDEAPPPPPPPDPPPPVIALPTAEEIQHIQQQAYQEGFAAGMKDGQAAGQAMAQHLQAVMEELQQAMRVFEEAMADEILALALDVARQMVRTSLAVEPTLVLAVVREAIESLPQTYHRPTLVLHPEDAKLVRDMLAQEYHGESWRIVEDAHLERGGCRIETGATEIDADLEGRWRRIVNALGTDVPWRK